MIPFSTSGCRLVIGSPRITILGFIKKERDCCIMNELKEIGYTYMS